MQTTTSTEMAEQAAMAEAIQRAEQANHILSHPLMVEALASIRQEFNQAWANSPARDKEGREEIWRMLKLLEKVEGHLKSVLETGRMTRHQLSLMERAKELAKSALPWA